MLGSGGTWTGIGAGASTAFTIVQADSGTSPTADSATDTLTLASNNSYLTIVGSSTADSIHFTVVAGPTNTVSTIVARDSSGHFAAGNVYHGDGADTAPSMSFDNDRDNGFYRIGANKWAGVAGGKVAFQMLLATSGNYSNLGFGGDASLSDSYVMLMQRSLESVPFVAQIANPNTAAFSAAKWQLTCDNGTIYGEIGVYTAASTLDAYGGRMTVRPSESATGLSLIAGDLSNGDVRIYAGGYTSTDRIASFNTTDGLKIENNHKLTLPKTVTAAGTTGNQTIDKISGTVNIAAAGTAVTVTCADCSTSSIVHAVIRTNDTTARIANVVPGSGSFVINLTAAATAEISIGFLVTN